MASDSRALTLKLLADVADYQRKLDQSEKVTDGFSGKVQEFGKKAAAAFAVAAAAAAAYAGKLLVDGVKAAIADEAAQTKLATALRNATDATETQIKSTEEYITKTSIAVGVTDDELRPSLQRLAIATGDVTKAQNLQKLALDIAAGSGKSLETVSNALARAYEGNTASLGRLGIGLSTAELKTMTFDEVTAQLADTFKNQATIQADTFQGRMARLQIAFDETKEAVGARLLPILTNLFTLFTDKVIPAAQQLLDKFKPLTTAIENNKEEFQALWDFISKYIVPILSNALKSAFQGTITAITLMVNAVGKAVDFFENLYNIYRKLIDFIKNNPLANLLGKFNPFSNTSFNNASFMTGGDTGGAFVIGGVSDGSTGDGSNVGKPIFDATGTVVTSPGLGTRDISGLTEMQQKAVRRSIELQEKTAEIRARIAARNAGNNGNGQNIVTVNIGVAGDPEGTARTIRDVMSDSFNRGTGGLVGAF